jgi:hypothetical protein
MRSPHPKYKSSPTVQSLSKEIGDTGDGEAVHEKNSIWKKIESKQITYSEGQTRLACVLKRLRERLEAKETVDEIYHLLAKLKASRPAPGNPG